MIEKRKGKRKKGEKEEKLLTTISFLCWHRKERKKKWQLT